MSESSCSCPSAWPTNCRSSCPAGSGRSFDGALSDELGEQLANIVVLQEAVYAAFEDNARARSLRDPDDWPDAAPTRRHRPRYFGPIASGSG